MFEKFAKATPSMEAFQKSSTSTMELKPEYRYLDPRLSSLEPSSIQRGPRKGWMRGKAMNGVTQSSSNLECLSSSLTAVTNQQIRAR